MLIEFATAHIYVILFFTLVYSGLYQSKKHFQQTTTEPKTIISSSFQGFYYAVMTHTLLGDQGSLPISYPAKIATLSHASIAWILTISTGITLIRLKLPFLGR